MVTRPTVLCPIDLSEPSRAALRYASAIAEHFCAELTLLTVSEPLVTEALEMKTGTTWFADEATRTLRKFFDDTFPHGTPDGIHVTFEVTRGKAAPAILESAREHGCDIIVMSTHGLTGLRKVFFGSTTERVLRETTLPVLVTPPDDPGQMALDDFPGLVRHVLAPVDLTSATARQVVVARALADALGVPLLLLHVVEPIESRAFEKGRLEPVAAARAAGARRTLAEMVSSIPARVRAEGLVLQGRPPEVIASVARERAAGLIIMGLHNPAGVGPRMGSVTYQVLCRIPALVLALPPAAPAAVHHVASPALEEISARIQGESLLPAAP